MAGRDLENRTLNKPEDLLKKVIRHVELLGLVIIALATIYAGYLEVMSMIMAKTVGLGDLLLLFLYLEVLAMVAIYVESGKLPIRLPIYIAIVAIARYLILEMKNLSEWEMIALAVTVTLLSISTLILRYGTVRFPYNSKKKKNTIKSENQDS
jgi:protein PsiE